MMESAHPNELRLQSYHDGELDDATAATVAEHCHQCAACAEVLAELDLVTQRLAHDPGPELSRSIWRQVRPSREKADRLRPAFAIAACAAGIVLGVFLGPVRFSAEDVATDSSQSTELDVLWSGGTSSSLLSVYRVSQE